MKERMKMTKDAFDTLLETLFDENQRGEQPEYYILKYTKPFRDMRYGFALIEMFNAHIKNFLVMWIQFEFCES
jgi:hypothetical protein